MSAATEFGRALLSRKKLPRAASTQTSTLPRPEPLARLLSELGGDAALLGADQMGEGGESLVGSEAAKSFAAERNLDLLLEKRKAETLRRTDFPAIVLMRSGAGRLLLGRSGRRFDARADGQDYEIALDALACEEAGSVFLVRPRTQVGESLALIPKNPSGGADPTTTVLAHMMTRQRAMLAQLLLAATFSNMMLLALPVYTGLVYDRVIPHSAFDTLWAVSIGVTLALAGDLTMRSVRLKLQDALASAASASIQASMVRKLFEGRMSDAPRSAAVVTMKLRELDGLTQIAPMFFAGVFVDAPFLVLVFTLIWINGGAIVFAPIFGLVSLALIHHLTSHLAKADQARTTRLAQLQTNRMIEAIEGLESIKTTRTERKMIDRFERLFDEYSYASHVTKLWNGVAAYANVSIGQFMVVLVMIIGVYEVSEGLMTLGGLSSCSLLVGRIINPIGQLIVIMHKMAQSRNTLAALANGDAVRPESAGDVTGFLGAPHGDIRFQNVCFVYPGQTSPQLNDVSLTIRSGERVAIIGRSGSGKTTLLKQLVRLLEPERGSILIGEVDVRQYPPSRLRCSLGYMGQSSGLFDDTLLANLIWGTEAPDRTRVETVCKLTGVADFAQRHPKGYGMPLGPRGENLSGGERQSTLLARLLIGTHETLLLDEPTAAMDTMLEARFVREFGRELGARTLIVATHRAPILELVDRLIWLDAGRVVADGSKSEVLRKMSGAAA